MKKNEPIYKKRVGPISTAIFERCFEKEDFKTKDKIIVKKLGVVLQRGYKKKGEDKWENEIINFPNIIELKKAILLLQDAEEKILMNEIEVEGLPKEVAAKKERRIKDV